MGLVYSFGQAWPDDGCPSIPAGKDGEPGALEVVGEPVLPAAAVPVVVPLPSGQLGFIHKTIAVATTPANEPRHVPMIARRLTENDRFRGDRRPG